MKKVILTGTALVAFAAASFAQSNTATVNQVGDAQSAAPTQTGQYQKSTINQNEGAAQNYGNRAITTQTGNALNEATVNQNDGSSANRAGITQENGTGNAATINQNNNSGGGNVVADNDPTTQDGDGNWAGAYQSGPGNTATLNQNNGSRRNFVETYQYGTGAGNDATVNQNDNSEDNKARVYQGDGGNAVQNSTAIINQNGGGLGSSDGNTATVDQDGSDQTGTINQNNNSYNNTASVNQTGGTGEATINQINFSYNNTATANQGAGDHTALIEQTTNSHDNTATVNQFGSGTDDAKILQVYETADNTATINQNATLTGTNTAKITQQSAYINNAATINQSNGSGNVAEIIQGKANEPVGGDIASMNSATLSQDGSDNMGKLVQTGDNHIATLNQTGTGNVIKGTALSADPTFATQMGDGNTLNVTHSGGTAVGSANVAEAYQNGMGNTATINQTYQP